MNKIYYWKLCFYGNEGETETDERECSYVIKTEIPNMDKETALSILFGDNPTGWELELANNCTALLPTDEAEAYSCYDVDELTEWVNTKYGVVFRVVGVTH
jgi:hypothetical protein